MRGLGELEAAVMNVLWQGRGPRRVRDVLDEVNKERKLAYTTVMTVLDNLHRKGWTVRQMRNRAYEYEASMSRDEAAARALRELLDSTADPESVLMHFARSMSKRESEVLRKALGDQ